VQHFCSVFQGWKFKSSSILRCWLAKIKHRIWCCTTSPNIN